MKPKTRANRWRAALLAMLTFAGFAASAAAVSYAQTRQGRFVERRTVEDRRERRRLVRRSVVAVWRAGILERRRANPERFERSRRGEYVLRGQVIAIDPGPAALSAAQALGFRILRERSFGDLGVRILVLAPPRTMSAQEALEALRAADPGGSFELNHLFDPSQGASPSGGPVSRSAAANVGAGVKLGMIDGGVAANHPALQGARVVTRAFAGDTLVASPHGTAVASLLVGVDGDFHGVAPGAELYAADVFGDSPDGGSAEDISAALGWLSQQGVTVVNISLEGPPNRLVEAVCRAAIARGMILVAAVGNGGPTNPVAYPAAYPGVVAVTAIDDRNRVYLSANRGPQVAFAALGVSVEAAAESDEYEIVSGTSFASPIVAAELALLRRNASSPTIAVQALAARALDLGAPGRDDVYGFGRVM
jgi:subtilisin family serine protease